MATSVTNLEIHDIARTCMTFGIDLCYIVTPLIKQREIAEKLIRHWVHGYGATYNPARGEALRKVRIMATAEEMIDHMGREERPLVVGTSSRERAHKAVTYQELNGFIQREARPCVVLFGTGWGLADEIVDGCDKMLVPIRGKGNYNHLSLRVAIGIILDRIFGERGGHNE